jgi:zinc transport system ATP-binding protein
VNDAQWVLRARGARLGYRRQAVLSGVELCVRPGEFWFFLGRNGSGKTTLLRGILGLLAPLAGQLERHPALCARERLGYVPQRSQQNPSLPTTVHEFVTLGFVGIHLDRRRRAEQLAWALERTHLAELVHQDYWALSGGQRQRALVARALVRRPSLLVLDEPTEGFDVPTEESLLRTLADLRAEDGLTILFVTHKLSVAERFATHVALFAEGRVAAGPRDAVLGDAARRVFGGAEDET